MRSSKILTGSSLAVALYMIMAAVIYAAPGATDEVEGTIKDALGRPLPGAGLILKSPDGTIIGKSQSDADGHFAFSGVKPGSYTVLAEKPGFQSSTAVLTVEALIDRWKVLNGGRPIQHSLFLISPYRLSDFLTAAVEKIRTNKKSNESRKLPI